MLTVSLLQFIRESNGIEGIHRGPTDAEIEAHRSLFALPQISPVTLNLFQSEVAPGKPLRLERGMDVRVGSYIAPRGGPHIGAGLGAIIDRANAGDDPWSVHVQFETLHPYMDGNGRTGRALWVWQMMQLGHDPFAISFLHRFYYQTLEHSPGREAALSPRNHQDAT